MYITSSHFSNYIVALKKLTTQMVTSTFDSGKMIFPCSLIIDPSRSYFSRPLFDKEWVNNGCCFGSNQPMNSYYSRKQMHVYNDLERCSSISTFYPLRRESRWSKDHDKLLRSAEPPMNGSEEVWGTTKGSNEQQKQ